MRRSLTPTLALAALALTLSGCHEHDHDHAGHEPGHEHEHEQGHGHGHGHGEGAQAFTVFSEHTELFVEVPPLAVGEPAELAAHLTRLSDLRPLREGEVTVELTAPGGAVQRFSASVSAVPGIFRPVVRATGAGSYRVVVRARYGDVDAAHALGELTVHATAEAAKAAAPQEHEEGEAPITFTKEQQWRVDFGTAPAALTKVRPSFEAYGTLRPRPAGEARVVAPLGGRLDTEQAPPVLGRDVKKGDVLFALAPRLGEQGDLPALQAAVGDAHIAAKQARRELARLEPLLKAGAIPERRVVEARFALERAQNALRAARRRVGQATAAEASGGAGTRVEVTAPLDGTLVAVEAVPGSWAEAGTPLARIIDLERLWLEVHVAETHAGELATPHGVWFEVEGFEAPFEVGPEGVVTAGGVVDPKSRTVPLYIAVPNADRRLRSGMFAEVHVVTEAPRYALTVPRSAILFEQGLAVVYVLVDGEHFERRVVRTGVRDGARLEVVDGLVEGERVVSVGAYLVRLAGASDAAPGHGHAH